MRIQVEQQTRQVRENGGEEYWTFWVRYYDPRTGWYVAQAGYRYFPGRDTLSTPSLPKGGGKYANTTKTCPEVYNEIKRQIQQLVCA